MHLNKKYICGPIKAKIVTCIKLIDGFSNQIVLFFKIIIWLVSLFCFSDIRVQLNEQLKCLDGRLETQQSVVSEVQDIFRRKAEIESNYSKELNKLANHIANRNKEQKQK